jgi:2-C-methyl-D-erythritol 4-phosphate cytidylyltransferase
MRQEFADALTGFDVTLVEGGATRNESTASALTHVRDELVLIHDAVRPLVTAQTIDRVIDALEGGAAAVDPVIGSTDTLVRHRGGLVEEFPDRAHIWRGQTPQGFQTIVLRAAYAFGDGEQSDDCQVVAAAGFPVTVVGGDESNIKITHPGDFTVADRLFQARRTTPSGDPFTGRVVVVGGSTGIGAQVAKLTGAAVVGRSTGFDVTDPDPAVFEDADVVLVTAGVLHGGPLLEMTDDFVNAQLSVNLAGPIRIARAAYKHLAATRGHLILCSSSSYTRGRGNLAVYSATKAAIVALTQALAEEWPDVRVNSVCPERTATPMRTKAFGVEPPETLMTAEDAAAQLVAMFGTTLTGQAFDIRRELA